MVDYAVIAGILEMQGRTIEGAVVLDSNQDGISELFIVEENPESICPTYYAFSNGTNPVCAIHSVYGASDSQHMAITRDNEVFLEWDYSVAICGQTKYWKWDYGWELQVESEYVEDEEKGLSQTFTSEETEISEDSYQTIVKKYEDYVEIPNQLENIKNVSLENVNYDVVVSDFQAYLTKCGQDYSFKEVDLDQDGVNEGCFLVNDYMALWSKYVSYFNSSDEERIADFFEMYDTFIYLDETDGYISFHVKYIDKTEAENKILDISVSDTLNFYMESNYIYEYEISETGALLNLKKIYYHGSLEEEIYTQTFYQPCPQDACWTVWTFQKDGTCRIEDICGKTDTRHF